MNTTTRIQIVLLVALILPVLANMVHRTPAGRAVEFAVSVALILNGIFGLWQLRRR